MVFFPITYGRQYTHKYVYQPYRLSGNASTIRTLLPIGWKSGRVTKNNQ